MPPLFTHSSTRVFQNYNIAQKQVPFVSIPSVNIGLMWTALGRLSASVIQLKIWDFAGAWTVFNTMGLKIRDIRSAEILAAVDPQVIDENWGLQSAHMVAGDDVFDKLRDILIRRE